MGIVATKINNIIDWFGDFKHHVYDFSIDVFSFCFKMLMMVGLQTPSFIFDNQFTSYSTIVFSLISISLIIFLTIYESIMQMLNKVTDKKFTKFETILKRLPIAVGVSGFAPFLFQQGFNMLNKLTNGISKIGTSLFSENDISSTVSLSTVDVIGMLLFDFTLIGLLIPILLQAGRRWWDIFSLSAITPLALTAFIFDRHRHLYNMWWTTIKKAVNIQLIYTTFIVLIGIFMYGARFISADFWAFKLLIIIGALFRLANPPSFVKNYTRGEEDVVGMFDSYKKTFTGVYDTVTLKKLNPLSYYKQQKLADMQRKSLRQTHGKRFVDNLIKK